MLPCTYICGEHGLFQRLIEQTVGLFYMYPGWRRRCGY